MKSRLATTTGLLRTLLIAMALLTPWRASASDGQDPVDQADAALIGEEASEPADEARPARRSPGIEASSRSDVMASRPFVAGAIRVEGAIRFRPADFAPAIEAYLGQPLDRETLARLARDVADVARGHGYGLATAWIPQQQVTNGVLVVRINEGRVDAIEATGPAASAVERALEDLADGRPIRTAELERRLLLAGDLPGISLGRARIVRSGERSILRVETAMRQMSGRVSVDNWGTSAVGPIRARVYADFNGLLAVGDQLSVGASVTPAQPREFQFIQAGYSLPIGNGGTRVSFRGYLSRSRAGAELRDRDLEGNSAEIEAGLSHPLVRSRESSLWGNVSFGLRDSALSRTDTPARDDRIVTVNSGLYGWTRLGRGLGRARLSLTQGLDAFGATKAGDPLASRSDADGAFTKFTAWAEYGRPMGGNFSFLLSGEAQLASGPLLASEEMGLGGRSFLRGYDYREYSGDRGVAGSAELRFDLKDLPRPARGVQLYLYADAGTVGNLDGGRGGGSLASAGGGVRIRVEPRIEAGLELGIPMRDGSDGDRPNPRLSFSITARF